MQTLEEIHSSLLAALINFNEYITDDLLAEANIYLKGDSSDVTPLNKVLALRKIQGLLRDAVVNLSDLLDDEAYN